jgi:hypothetical protein
MAPCLLWYYLPTELGDGLENQDREEHFCRPPSLWRASPASIGELTVSVASPLPSGRVLFLLPTGLARDVCESPTAERGWWWLGADF